MTDEWVALAESKQWKERKEAVDKLLEALQKNERLEAKSEKMNIVFDILGRIVEKDANINVAAVAVKCIALSAVQLRFSFAPYTQKVSDRS